MGYMDWFHFRDVLLHRHVSVPSIVEPMGCWPRHWLVQRQVVVGRIMFSPEMMKTAQSMMANMSPEELLAEICQQWGDNLKKIFGEKRT